MNHRILRGLTVAAAAMALLLGSVPTAQAKIVERGEWADSGTDSFDDCGFEVDVAWEDSGTWKVRAEKPGSPAFMLHAQYQWRDVLSNPETGAWMVVRGSAVFKEVKATHVEGDVYTFRMHEAGQPLVVEDSAGNVVVRDRGLVVWEAVFDTFGDDQPGGEELSFELVSTHGPHPALFMTGDEICATITDLIG